MSSQILFLWSSQVPLINCTVLTSNKATTRHKKAFRNAIWLRRDFRMHMFCSCYLTADKSLRHTTVQDNVWLWPPLPDSPWAKGKHANLSSQRVLWRRGRPPSPSASASAAVEFRPCAPCSLYTSGSRPGSYDSDFPWADMFVTSQGAVWKNVYQILINVRAAQTGERYQLWLLTKGPQQSLDGRSNTSDCVTFIYS